MADATAAVKHAAAQLSASEGEQTGALYNRVMWRIMPLLVACYIVSFIDRANVGFAKIQFMGDLRFTNAQYGIGAGVFYLGYILLEIPSNQLLARIGARLTLLRIMVLWGLFCTAMAWMASPTHFYILRFLLGAAEAGFFPGVLLYLTFWIPAKFRARFTAIFMAGIPVAGLLGGPIAGIVLSGMDGLGGLRGWQWLFIVEGLPAVFLGIAVYFLLSDRPASCSWLSPAEREQIESDLREDLNTKSATAHASFMSALRDPSFYTLGLLGFGIMVSTAGVFFWLPSMIEESGVVDPMTIGLLSAIPFAGAVIVQYLVARRSDLTKERRLHAAVPVILGGLGWLLLPSATGHLALAMLALTLATAGTMAAMGPFWTLPSALLSGSATAGGIALVTSFAGIGNFFSPILVGWLVDRTGSLAAGQYYFGVLLLLGGGLLAFGPKSLRR